MRPGYPASDRALHLSYDGRVSAAMHEGGKIMFRRVSGWAVLSAVFGVGCATTQAADAPAVSEPATAPAESASGSAEPESAQPAASAPSAAAENGEAVSAATQAAEAWLKLVDGAKYAESWEAAATPFRGAVNAETWAKAAGGVRAPLGSVVSRRVSAADYTTTLPGVPDGKYVVIKFDTTFEHKASAVETVTPMAESDGSWKVAGYFIK